MTTSATQPMQLLQYLYYFFIEKRWAYTCRLSYTSTMYIIFYTITLHLTLNDKTLKKIWDLPILQTDQTKNDLHSALIVPMLIGSNGVLAACLGRKRSLHKYLEIRVRGVVTRQNAARVFITGRGLPARMARPWAVARCRARWVFNLNSWKYKYSSLTFWRIFLYHLHNNACSISTVWEKKRCFYQIKMFKWHFCETLDKISISLGQQGKP